jgi:hypothetical protein
LLGQCGVFLELTSTTTATATATTPPTPTTPRVSSSSLSSGRTSASKPVIGHPVLLDFGIAIPPPMSLTSGSMHTASITTITNREPADYLRQPAVPQASVRPYELLSYECNCPVRSFGMCEHVWSGVKRIHEATKASAIRSLRSNGESSISEMDGGELPDPKSS